MANYSADTKRRRSVAASDAMARVAEHRRCPKCQRKAALGERVRWEGVGSARKCRYCGHECGTTYGKPFGYDIGSSGGDTGEDKDG
jgi:hypothetical protein